MSASEPKPPESGANDVMNLVGLRLWVLCALVIVCFGIANYILNWIIGSH